MSKKIIALATSLTLLLSCLCSTVGAVNTPDGNTLHPGIDSVTWNAIYEQLEAQNALDMLDIFVQIYSSTNPGAVLYGDFDEITSVYAEFGGTMEYTTRQNNAKIDVAITHLDKDHTLYYVLDSYRIKPEKIILAILGYLPFVGPIASTISNAEAIMTSQAANSIINASGYSKLVTTSYTGGGVVTTVAGWDRYPYMYLHDTSALNIKTTVFPKRNPFPS